MGDAGRSEALGTLGHELRAPLRVAIGLGAVLQEEHRDSLSADAAMLLEALLGAVERAEAIVAAIAAMYGGEVREPEDTPLADALTAALADLAPQIAEAGAQVMSDPLPAVRADAVQLAQVVRNLVSNAIVHNPHRATRVHVAATPDDNDEVVVCVSDDGAGIPADDLERVFTRGAQTSRSGPGQGIGLDLCRRIVCGWGGRIWAETREPEGVRLYFTVPPAETAQGGRRSP